MDGAGADLEVCRFRAAAKIAGKKSLGAESGAGASRFISSRKPVCRLPFRKDASESTCENKPRFVVIPEMWYSETARRMRAVAICLVSPQTTSVANRDRNHWHNRSRRRYPPSTRIPGPPRFNVIERLCRTGKKLFVDLRRRPSALDRGASQEDILLVQSEVSTRGDAELLSGPGRCR